jgi:hypothetical protein
MIDNVSLQIETLAAKCGSYKEAFLDFAEKSEILDCEDLLESLNSNLVAKIRQEFIDKNYIPRLKRDNIFDFMKD